MSEFAYFIVPPIFEFHAKDPQYAFTFAIMLFVISVTCMLTHKLKDLSYQKKLITRQAELLDLTSDAICVWSLDGEIKYWNDGAEKLYGWQRQEALGKKIQDLLSPDYHKSFQEVVDLLIVEGSCSADIIYKCKSGTPVVVSSRCSLKRNHRGIPEAIVEFATDVSDQRLAEKRVREFYSTVSHELRTPLTAVKGVLGLIQEGIVDANSEEGVELINSASENSENLTRLVNDILDLQKLEDGLISLNVQNSSSKELICGVIHTLQILAASKNIKLIAITNYSGASGN